MKGLARFREGKVGFIHPLVVEALVECSAQLASTDGTMSFRTSVADDHRFLATQCMQYLLLIDSRVDDEEQEGEEDESETAAGRSFLSTCSVTQSSVTTCASTDESEHTFDVLDPLPFAPGPPISSTAIASYTHQPSPSRNSSEMLETPAEVMAKTFPLLDYAANFWAIHYRECKGDDDPGLKGLAIRLLRHSGTSKWVEYLLETHVDGMVDRRNITILTLACYLGLDGIVETIQGHETTPESLHWAAYNGHSRCIDVLLRKAGRRFDWRNDLASRAFHAAVGRGHDEAARRIIKHQRLDINHPGPTAITPLVAAVVAGCKSTVQEILKMPNTDPNATGPSLVSPLLCAVNSEAADCLRMLLNDERTKVLEFNENGRSVLSLACEAGQTEIVEILVDDGRLDINSQDDRGRTPLMYAVTKRHDKIVELLLRQSGTIDVRIEDLKGRNAISLAASTSTPEIFERLLDFDPSSASVRCREGYTVFQWTLDPPERPRIADILLRKFPNELKGSAARAMFSYALYWGAFRTAQLLVFRHTFDVNMVSDNGDSALSEAITYAVKRFDFRPLKTIMGVQGVDVSEERCITLRKLHSDLHRR
jgi:ankyrin repeat protein